MSFSKNSAQRTVGNIIRNLKMNGSKFMKLKFIVPGRAPSI